MTWPDAFYVTYDLDTVGGVTGIRENGSALLASYVYDNLGRLVTKTLGNGNVTSFTYDTAQRLATMTRDFSGTGSDQTSTFTWNAASQQVAQDVTNTSIIAPAPGAATANYAVNGLNQYATVGGVTFTYDANGNLTSDGVKTYGYDIYNRMTSATGAGTFGYDPWGRLYYNIVGSASTTFSHDGAEIAAEYDGTGALQRRYVRGPGFDAPVVWYEGSGTSDRRYLSADERGSIVTVADSSGAVIANNTFDEYGQPGSGNLGRFQYTGQAWLPAAGVYHYKARAYSASLGRFLQIGEAMLLFAYSPFSTGGPYAETGPVFVHERDCAAAAPLKGELPEVTRVRKQVIVRAYDQAGAINDAALVDTPDAAAVLERFFDDADVAFAHVRSVTYGCFTYVVERAET